MHPDIEGWVCQAFVKTLLDWVLSYIHGQYKWPKKIERNLWKLHAFLRSIQLSLLEAEKVKLNAEQNPHLVDWMWQLKDVVEEAEDVLDEMEYYRLESQIMKRSEVRSPGAESNRRLFNYRFSASKLKHKLVKIRKRVLWDHTVERLIGVVDKLSHVNLIKPDLSNFGSISSRHGNNNNNYHHETGGELTEMIGRDEDKKWILVWLKDSSESVIDALIIWGIGGVGKTTLAQAMYNEIDVENYFQVKMWVSFSNYRFDIKDIMKNAIECVNKDYPNLSSINNLQNELKRIVLSKKCLLILDNVWVDKNNLNLCEWEKFIVILSNHADRGSKIIITSRTEDAQIILTHFTTIKKDFHNLKCLEEGESLSLFNKHAFDDTRSDRYIRFQSTAKNVAKKCLGLPLALKSLGAYLNNKDTSEWISVLNNGILNSEHKVGNVLIEILNISYQRLSTNLQSCFKLCSLFPQGYMYKKDELLRLWIVGGFIEQKNVDIIKIFHQNYLDKLVKLSFLISHGNGRYTMHDLLHGLANDMSRGECLRLEGNMPTITLPGTLRHLSIKELCPDMFDQISKLKKLRTLIILSCKSADPNELYLNKLNEMLIKLKTLRVLYLDIESTPNLHAIGGLIHLRSVHMQVYVLDKPLKPLYKLYHLKNLKCEENIEMHDAHHGIEVTGVGNLVNLMYLDVCEPLFNKITQLRHLVNLQEVDFHLKMDNAFKLSDLKDLNELRRVAITDEREEIINVEEAKEANLDKKNYLETLSLSLNLNTNDSELHEKVYNCLKPKVLSNINYLRLDHYEGARAPSWMTSYYLPCTKHIELHNCSNLRDMPPLGQLWFLEVLILRDIPKVKQLDDKIFGSSENKGFLKKLEIYNMDTLKSISRFPCIEKLTIHDCTKLYELPDLPLTLRLFEIDNVSLKILPGWQEKNDEREDKKVEKVRLRNCGDLCSVSGLCSHTYVFELQIICCNKLVQSLASSSSASASSTSYKSRQLWSPFGVRSLVTDNVLLLQIQPIISIRSAEVLILIDHKATKFPYQWMQQNLTSLTTVFLSKSLSYLDSIEAYTSSITEADIKLCPELQSLPSNMHLSLVKLDAQKYYQEQQRMCLSHSKLKLKDSLACNHQSENIYLEEEIPNLKFNL